MRTKMEVLLGCMICLLMAVPAAALPPPENFSATVGDDDVQFDWEDVAGAAKYSVDIDATVIYSDGIVDLEASVNLAYGTSSRTDEGLMGDSDLTVAKDQIIEDILAALAAQGVDTTTIVSLEIQASGRVKALKPGKGAGSQKGEWSNLYDFGFSWTAP